MTDNETAFFFDGVGWGNVNENFHIF